MCGDGARGQNPDILKNVFFILFQTDRSYYPWFDAYLYRTWPVEFDERPIVRSICSCSFS